MPGSMEPSDSVLTTSSCPPMPLPWRCGALLAAGRHPGWFSHLGAWVGYGALLSALLDAIENLLQFQQLFHARVGLALIIGLIATLKFTLIIFGLLYSLTGWLWKKPLISTPKM